MIAFLFLLMTVAMIFAWRDHWRTSYGLFAITIVLSAYWLKFHATTPLSIIL
jgi:hypothetical protein